MLVAPLTSILQLINTRTFPGKRKRRPDCDDERQQDYNASHSEYRLKGDSNICHPHLPEDCMKDAAQSR